MSLASTSLWLARHVCKCGSISAGHPTSLLSSQTYGTTVCFCFLTIKCVHASASDILNSIDMYHFQVGALRPWAQSTTLVSLGHANWQHAPWWLLHQPGSPIWSRALDKLNLETGHVSQGRNKSCSNHPEFLKLFVTSALPDLT